MTRDRKEVREALNTMFAGDAITGANAVAIMLSVIDTMTYTVGLKQANDDLMQTLEKVRSNPVHALTTSDYVQHVSDIFGGTTTEQHGRLVEYFDMYVTPLARELTEARRERK